MRHLAKKYFARHLPALAVGAVLFGASTLMATAPASAAVTVGIGVGAPYVAPPCSYYNPYYCGYYSYSDPVFVGGTWWYGPHWYRWWGGHSWVWWHGGWRTGFNGGWRGWSWHGSWRGGWGRHGGRR